MRSELVQLQTTVANMADTQRPHQEARTAALAQMRTIAEQVRVLDTEARAIERQIDGKTQEVERLQRRITDERKKQARASGSVLRACLPTAL